MRPDSSASSFGRLCAALAAAAVLVGGAAPAAAQQGTITGQVTDQTSGQPLVGARVSVVGTSLVTMSRAEGRYRIADRKSTRLLQSRSDLVCRLLLEKKKAHV